MDSSIEEYNLFCCISGEYLRDLQPPVSVPVETVRGSLQKVRHLSLSLDQRLIGETFDRLLRLIPNVTSLEIYCRESPDVVPRIRNGTMAYKRQIRLQHLRRASH